MDLSIPRKNLSDMVLYVWKIIGSSSISLNDLLFKLSFDLFLFDPKEAKNFIENSISKKYIVLDNNYIQLSKELNQVLEEWQIKRKKDISEKLESSIKIKVLNIEKGLRRNSNQFKSSFNYFVDDATAGRSVSILASDITLLSFDYENGNIEATIKGTEADTYIVELNSNLKILKHNCHDFQTKKSKSKKLIVR